MLRLTFLSVIGVGSILIVDVAFADSIRLIAIGYEREFTHIDSKIGEVPPTHQNLPFRMQALAWSPDGRLFAGGEEGQLYTLDPATGEVTSETATRIEIRGMAFALDGILYATSRDTLYQLDPSTGEHTRIAGLHGDGDSAQGLDFSPGGELYAITPYQQGRGSHQLMRLDITSGELHEIGHVVLGSHPNQSIAFTPDGRLFAVGDPFFAELNPEDATIISELPLNGDYRGLALAQGPSPPVGDLNCDLFVNAFDIEPFIVALFEPENYPVLYPDCDINLGDINGDGSIDPLDIEPFLNLLFP